MGTLYYENYKAFACPIKQLLSFQTNKSVVHGSKSPRCSHNDLYIDTHLSLLKDLKLPLTSSRYATNHDPLRGSKNAVAWTDFVRDN